MHHKIKNFAQNLHPKQIPNLVFDLLKDEAISGKVILVAVALALIAANSSLSDIYKAFWDTELSIGLDNWKLSMDLRRWVTDGLMTFFFLVVGLELRRELTEGELQNRRTAALPFGAALGGMIMPALIFVTFNLGSPALAGWAIPIATDIALAIGIIALLGKRIPSSIRIFLLTLAIIDDIVAVIVIAVFYSTGINIAMLLTLSALVAALYLFRHARFMVMPVFILLGLTLWLVVHRSGVHASIAGAILGLLAPTAVNTTTSVADRGEKAIIPFSTLVAVPLFAFANTGIPLWGMRIPSESVNLAAGIIAGLVVGKSAGIFGATWLMVKLGLADMPSHASWRHILGVGLLAGIGFTVAIFVTELAFNDVQLIELTKICIFVASALSALVGFIVLRSSDKGSAVMQKPSDELE